jgi:hypothetical protein
MARRVQVPCGRLFVNAGIFYLYLARVSGPLLGTNLSRRLRSEIIGMRVIGHAALFVTFF